MEAIEMKIYHSMSQTTDGWNSGPEEDQGYTEHLYKQLGVSNFRFGYCGEEMKYHRLSKFASTIDPRLALPLFEVYAIPCHPAKYPLIELVKIGKTKINCVARREQICRDFPVIPHGPIYHRGHLTETEQGKFEKFLHRTFRHLKFTDDQDFKKAREFFREENGRVIQTLIEKWGFVLEDGK